MCSLYQSLHYVLYLYGLVLLVYAVLSWVPDLRGSWSRFLDMLVLPVLTPVRRVIPPAGGLDLSFIVLIVVLYLINGLIARAAINACSLMY